MVENMRIRVPYVNTVDNYADFFTKPLPPRQFCVMRDLLMNVPHGQHEYPTCSGNGSDAAAVQPMGGC